MEIKATLIKNYRNKETLRLVGLQEIADVIRSGEYQEQVSNFRSVYPLADFKSRNQDGTLDSLPDWTKNLPRICFALQQENRMHECITKCYNGLVLLEVNNLTGQDEASAVRRGAAEMPQTLMTFVGADGQSVKIVCRGEQFTGGLPSDEGGTALFHENLYERARIIYNGQLGVTIEKLDPTTHRICYMSYDPLLFYNPLATAIYAKAEKPTEVIAHQSSSLEQTEGRLGMDRYKSMHTVFEYNLSKAFDETEGISDKDERHHAALSLLAQYCMETGLSMAPAMRQAMMKSVFWDEKELVVKVFENAYREDLVEKYMSKKGIKRTKNIPQETLLTMKVNIFLNSYYELRKNVMRGVPEYRMRTGIGFSFQDLTEEARNSITMRAMEQGIKCWDKDIRRYVNSDDIERYDPINDYLEHLPCWDGKDRVTPLAQRVPTEWKEWTYLFHIWMRSMVAMWQGKGQLTGNALVPLLIGRQGCGKSSFCRILLPRELQDYYNDRINFKNEQDLNLGLSSFGLINLDEFDKITQRQQIVLKYLVSTADLKYRPPYGKAYTSNRRYASFIGTTNEQTPLTDPSGSRRFLCVSIDGDIDFETPVQHAQLFAQVLQEIRQGECYWLSKDEERALMEHNLNYQRLNGLGEMLMSLIQKPRIDEDGEWLGLKDLSALIKSHFKGYKEDATSIQKIAAYLRRPEYKFQSKRASSGMLYLIKRRV
ncbi:MAG: hypothetical protein K5896_10810 [Prevotella sp.]|nr:hypothetical protein [Prevotella sp.]